MIRNAVNLRHLLQNACFVDCDTMFATHVCSDSRAVLPGDIFVAIAGTQSDGHDFVHAAVANGAVGIVTERRLESPGVPQCVVSDSAKAFAVACMAAQCGQTSGITSVGITGTNGKTTTSFLLHSILQHAGLQTGLLGTIQNSDGRNTEPATMTTPPADALAAYFSRMQKLRTSHCVVEVSSHALTQKRCAGMSLSAAAILNITQDHFDYHQTAAAYRTAKAQIAELLHHEAPLLLNLDDPDCSLLSKTLCSSIPVITFGVEHDDAELRAIVLSKTHRSQRIKLQLAQGTAEVRLRLIGQHNVSNSLAAAGLAEQLGIHLNHIVAGLEAVHSVPGRLERISEGQSFQVLVDYAHTPDALTRSIRTVRDFVPGRLICVFGAGGDRDHSKRPLMGAAASQSDLAIVTSDNPRSESASDIISQIVKGFSATANYLTETDRRCAIARAFAAAEPGDVVLIAGKGHENTQEISSQCFPFDDREVSRQLLLESKETGAMTDLHPLFSMPKSA